MRPNARERLMAGLVTKWTRVSLRPGDFVKVFGWSAAVPLSQEWATKTLGCFCALASHVDGGLVVGSVDQRNTSLASISPREFLNALGERNELDSSMGGAHIRSRSNEVGLLIDWMADPDAPLTTVIGTFSERWLDSEEHVGSLKRFASDLAVAASMEYLITAHVSDEARKMRGRPDRAGKVPGNRPAPRYETQPARGLPYLPWLLVLGPRYVEYFGKGRLEGLAAFESWWLDGYFSCTSSETPLDYGTRSTTEREEAIRRVLGHESFIDPSEPSRAAAGPLFHSSYKESTHPREGGVWDAYPAADGVRVIDRDRAG